MRVTQPSVICSVYGLDGVLYESMLRKAEMRHGRRRWADVGNVGNSEN